MQAQHCQMLGRYSSDGRKVIRGESQVYGQNADDGEVFSFFMSRDSEIGESQFLELDEAKVTYCGPGSWMLNLASQCPWSTCSSIVFPSTIPATKPPAKASLLRGNWSVISLVLPKN